MNNKKYRFAIAAATPSAWSVSKSPSGSYRRVSFNTITWKIFYKPKIKKNFFKQKLKIQCKKYTCYVLRINIVLCWLQLINYFNFFITIFRPQYWSRCSDATHIFKARGETLGSWSRIFSTPEYWGKTNRTKIKKKSPLLILNAVARHWVIKN